KLVDYWSDPDRMKQSYRNAVNKAKNKVTTHQGSKSFAQGRHEFVEMKAIQDESSAKTIPPMKDRGILDEVLKSINRYCTQEQFEDLKRQHALEIEEKRKAFESQQKVLKKFVNLFNRQQGTPSSQF
nr:hypothetical protein [Tanacetum cinerariifolium]